MLVKFNGERTTQSSESSLLVAPASHISHELDKCSINTEAELHKVPIDICEVA